MKQHIWGLAANRDIINPVPSMGKTDGELMFNKMANYAAYSTRNENKTVKTKDEVSCPCVEVKLKVFAVIKKFI